MQPYLDDFLDVLFAVRKEAGKAGTNWTQLRQTAIDTVARRWLDRERYKNLDSARKTIHDACVRRQPDIRNAAALDNIIGHWLMGDSGPLKKALASCEPTPPQSERIVELLR